MATKEKELGDARVPGQEQRGDALPALHTYDIDAVGVFRVSASTTATVNSRGEVTIRQLRKRGVSPGDLRVVHEEIIVKLPAADFALIGKMVGVVLGELTK